jgi:NitT/TauT family transport system substrate-binding protein
MRDSGLVDSEDSKRLGIGAMTDARWHDFYQTLVASGTAPAGLDVGKAYTLQFVNHKVGL